MDRTPTHWRSWIDYNKGNAVACISGSGRMEMTSTVRRKTPAAIDKACRASTTDFGKGTARGQIGDLQHAFEWLIKLQHEEDRRRDR